MEKHATSANDIQDPIKKSDMSHFLLSEIRIGSENQHLYDACSADNYDDRSLFESILRDGVKEPLVLTQDFYLVSGHRRRWAARRAGLEKVPVRFISEVYEELTAKQRLLLLRSFNHQRDKTSEERYKEGVVSIDPSTAHSTLLRRRIQKDMELKRRGREFGGAIELGVCRKRPKIQTLEFLEAVKAIIDDNEEYWPLTDRRVHYLLLNAPPLRHDKKPGSRYCNDAKSYKALSSLLTRARLTGEIPMESIDDPTRPVTLPAGFDNFSEFFNHEIHWLLDGYRRNLVQDQPAHIEIFLEKAALRIVVERIASEYCIPVTTTRGYASLSPRQEVVARFRRSGKRELVLLILADFDPDGEAIAASLARSFRDDFNVPESCMRAVKVGLTHEDVLSNDFPSDLEAKVSSANYKSFVQKYGNRVVELDAAPVEWIQGRLKEAIESHLDMGMFNAQFLEEEKDSVLLQEKKASILESLGLGV